MGNGCAFASERVLGLASTSSESKAEKIEKSLQATQPDSHELQVLSRRIRLCTNLQTLEEITAKNLSTWAEFDITLKAVSEYCPKFPIALKVKVTFAYTIREMHRVSEVVTEDSSDKQDLVNQVNKFLDCFLVHLGGGEEWDGCQPTMSGLCLEAFETLTGHVKDMEDGNATEESGFIEAAAGTCVEVLKAQFSCDTCFARHTLFSKNNTPGIWKLKSSRCDLPVWCGTGQPKVA